MTRPGETGPLLLPAADTLLLRLDHPRAEACRAELATFAELASSPEHLHTYRLSDLGLWNARSAGIDPGRVADVLLRYCDGPVPHAVLRAIAATMDRYGRVVIEGGEAGRSLVVRTDDPAQPAPRVIRISFVRCEGNEVTGWLEPYRDPDTGEKTSTTFEGLLDGNKLQGRFISYLESSGRRRVGTWNVIRKKDPAKP